MRSAKVIPISESDHFADYAEFPHLDESWDDRVTRFLMEDKYRDAMASTAVIVGGALLLWLVAKALVLL